MASAHTVTAAALAGDFTGLESASCVAAGARTLNTPFSNNQIDPAQYDPASVKLFSAGYVPVSNDPCGLLSYTVPAIDNEEQIIGRIDWVESQKHSIYGRYFVDDFRAPAPFDPKDLIVTQTPGNLERAQSFTLGVEVSSGLHALLDARNAARGPSVFCLDCSQLGPGFGILVVPVERIAS